MYFFLWCVVKSFCQFFFKMIWSPPKNQQKDPIPFAAPIFVLKSIWWIDASTPPRGFLVRNFWLHRKVHPVLWRFPWHHVSGDMLNLRGVRRCFVVFCGVQKDGGDVLCLFFSELGQILTKKCSENENKRFFFNQFCVFWLQASATTWSQFWNPEKSTKPHHRQDFCSKKDGIVLKFYKFHFFQQDYHIFQPAWMMHLGQLSLFLSSKYSTLCIGHWR